MSKRMNGWSTASPCRNCGKPDWCREQRELGLGICYRPPDNIGGGIPRRDKHGQPYILFVPDDWSPEKLPEPPEQPDRAEPSFLDAAYRSLFVGLSLNESHKKGLLDRGVSEEAICRHGFRSWPRHQRKKELASQLWREFGEACFTIPGWYSVDQQPMLTGGLGWVLPVFNADNQLIAIRHRSDRLGSAKYTWISSVRYGGPGPGAHPRMAFPHRQMQRGETAEVVRLVEGEAAAIVCAEHTGVPTISAPGVTGWRVCLPWLRLLETKRVRLAFDADWRTNRNVAAALLAARAGLAASGYSVQLETWGGDADVA